MILEIRKPVMTLTPSNLLDTVTADISIRMRTSLMLSPVFVTYPPITVCIVNICNRVAKHAWSCCCSEIATLDMRFKIFYSVFNLLICGYFIQTLDTDRIFHFTEWRYVIMRDLR